MQLTYGKFAPEFNPKVFSDLPKEFRAVEVDLFSYFTWNRKLAADFKRLLNKNQLQVIAKISLRPHRAKAEYHEAMDLWNEVFGDQTAYFLIQSGRKHWAEELSISELAKLPNHLSAFFEWGKDDTLRGTAFLKRLASYVGYVIDLDWHGASIRTLKTEAVHFKLHGWHEERWVRRYGVSGAQRMLKQARSRKDSFLTLSYSGMSAEASLFDSI